MTAASPTRRPAAVRHAYPGRVPRAPLARWLHPAPHAGPRRPGPTVAARHTARPAGADDAGGEPVLDGGRVHRAPSVPSCSGRPPATTRLHVASDPVSAATPPGRWFPSVLSLPYTSRIPRPSPAARRQVVFSKGGRERFGHACPTS